MKKMYSIALVGRPNVGKSCLFNRLIRKKLSIVHDQPGITRDVLSHEVDDQFIILDTGGISMFDHMTPKAIKEAVEEQVEFTVNASDLILFIVDGLEGLHSNDQLVADRLRASGKKVLLVVNKIDTFKHDDLAHEFYKLGFGEPISVSAEHGYGIDVLWQRIRNFFGIKKISLPVKENMEASERIRISFVGRPNVGKSSLSNALLSEKKLIVSDIPGTTRDAIEINLDYKAKEGKVIPFSLIDTAGLRARSKIGSSVEYFSALRTEGAVERADIVFLVIDAREGVTKVDQRLAGDVLKKGKGLILLVNKWDLVFKAFKEDKMEGYASVKDFQKAFVDALNKEFFFHPNSPILFTSAQDGYGIEHILKEAHLIHKKSKEKLPTGKLNRVIENLMNKRNPSLSDGRRFKIYYVVHTGCQPINIKIFCNQVTRLDESYRRYLEDGIIEAFGLRGLPVRFELVGKPPREKKGTEKKGK